MRYSSVTIEGAAGLVVFACFDRGVEVTGRPCALLRDGRKQTGLAQTRVYQLGGDLDTATMECARLVYGHRPTRAKPSGAVNWSGGEVLATNSEIYEVRELLMRMGLES